MARSNKNRNLIIVFVLLFGVVFGFRYWKSSQQDRNFNPDIVKIDTSLITEIKIYPKQADQKEILLWKKDGAWQVSTEDKTSKAMKNTVDQMLNELAKLKPGRLAAKSSDKWEKFEVTDSLATRIKVKEGENESLNLLIGKFSYKQSQQPGMRQGQGITGFSYVRIEGEEEVYSVNGFLNLIFNKSFNDFRDQTFLSVNESDIKSMSVRSPEDQYIIEKQDSIWTIGGQKLDENKINELTRLLALKNLKNFNDTFEPAGLPDYSFSISGRNALSEEVTAYQLDSANFAVHSTTNPGVYFNTGQDDLMKALFRPHTYYLDSANVIMQ